MLVKCTNCMEIFREEEIIYNKNKEIEICPNCGTDGCLMDLDTEKEIINNIKFSFSKAENQTTNLFSKSHVKYNCIMTYNDITLRQTYQCNPSFHKMDKDNILKNFLYCVLLDTQCYDDSRDIDDFAESLGYDRWEDEKKVNNIWESCERESNKIHEMFNDEELNMLNDYFKEW